MRTDLVYGIHAIHQLLETNPSDILELFIIESRGDTRIQNVIQTAKLSNIACHTISKKQLDNWLPNTPHQGVAARIRAKLFLTENDLGDLISHAKTPPLFLVLDGIQDPHNLGACLRSCDAFAVTAVIMPKDKQVGITPIVRKVASGATETVTLVQVSNIVRALEHLKELGVWIHGASGKAKTELHQVDLKGPVAIVLGAEGQGLRRLTEEHCDILMRIPMLGTVESLNVSVATAVCLYEVQRQRQFKSA